MTDKPYKLDWETADVRLGRGRFVHTLRRPDTEMILEREKDLHTDLPINKDGSYALPDATANEEVDARYYDRLTVSATGYPTDHIPEQHKAAAFQGLYMHEISVAEGADIFGGEIQVEEEIGTGPQPDFVITHVMRQPTEAELKTYRRKINSMHEVKAGKRGRQILATRSNLKVAMQHYELWMLRVEDATVNGETYSNDVRGQFVAAIDPLIQRKVVQELAGELSNQLLD